MPKYEIEVGAAITQTVEINADSLETAKEWAMDLLKRQLEDYQKDSIYGSNVHHNHFYVYDFDTLQANEAG